MKSILEHINQLSLNEWYYYERDFSKIQDWNDENEHSKFIKEYLRIAEKLEVIQHFERSGIPYDKIKRKMHTNSVFFLGCIFYKELKLYGKINFIRSDGKDEFFFIWFLSSLVHDFGYYLEDNPIPNLDDLKSFSTYFKIKYQLKKKSTINSENITTILMQHLESYYKVRMKGLIGRTKEPKIDHGIAAGLLLFDSLVKNRKYRKKLNEKKLQNSEETDNLYWGDELDYFYEVASSSIATHNMRRATKGDKLHSVYLDNGLSKLILNTEEDSISKLSIENEPFAFLFALVDTIEPLKQYEPCKPEAIFENIHIDVSGHDIIFKNSSDTLNFEPFIRNLKSLETWVKVKITELNNNEVKMELQ